MQPVKVTIPGDYWDSSIYQGRLILWEMSGRISVLRWEELIHEVAPIKHSFAAFCSLLESRALYGRNSKREILPIVREFNSDPDIRSVIQTKLLSLASTDLEISKVSLENNQVGWTEFDFSCLHDDVEIYSKNIYVLNEKGLFCTPMLKTKKSIRRKTTTEKIWDGQGYNLITGYGCAVIAAGDNGLLSLPTQESLEFDSEDEGGFPEPQIVSGAHCSFANWAYASIYGTSLHGDSRLAGFSWEKDDENDESQRTFHRLVSEKEIFQHEGLSWAGGDKIYQFRNGSLNVVRYTQKYVVSEADSSKAFELGGTIPVVSGRTDKPIRASVAYFGTIVEFSDSLWVYCSDGTVFTINEPITKWRIFPRAKSYETHLHVVLNDRIEIYSFIHDYFVDQDEKLAGMKFRG